MPGAILGRRRDILGEGQENKIDPALAEPYILVRGDGKIKPRSELLCSVWKGDKFYRGEKAFARIKEIQMRFGLGRCIWNVYRTVECV